MTTEPATLNGWIGLRQPNGDDAAPERAASNLIDVFDAVDVPIVVIRSDFKAACFNQAAGNVLGFLPSHIGLSPRDIPALCGMTDLEERCAEIIAGGPASRADFRYADKWFVVRIAPYANGGRQINGAVLTFINVTAFRASIDQAIYERECTKAVLNTIADPLLVLGADQRVQSANRAFYAMFRASRDQTQGVSVYDLAKGAFDNARLRMELNEMLAGGTSFQPIEVDHLFPEAGRRTFIVDARLLSLPGQSERRILLTFHDITARKRAEETSARLAAIIESSDDAIVGKTLDGIITSWNSGAEHVFGYAGHEVIGKPVTLLIPADRHYEETRILERIRGGERVGHYETVRRRKDARLIVVSLTVSPVRDAGGRVIAASKVARDITEHKRVEKNLSDFFENASVALHWVGPGGIILRANHHELEMLGYDHDEYVGRHISEFHVDQAAIADILKRLSAGEVISNYPSQLRCKDGSVRDVVIDSSVLWENDRFVHTRCFTTDVTARKKAEQAQRMLVGELQHRVKNTLATVQAIASQTLHSATVTEREAFVGRLHALSNAHDVLTQENWDRALLRDVVRRALEPFQKERIAIIGPHVPLDASKALLMTMVLHELATNAVKYGALSNATGQVRIDWTICEGADGTSLQFCWEERGGPPVREPSQKGFGSRLIGASLEESRVTFAPEGVTCTLEMLL
jgi:two-component system, chemotaxis family, CheB/CheR fusion protein